MVKASQGQHYKLPWAGDLAETMAASSGMKGEYHETPTRPEPTKEPPSAEKDLGKVVGEKVEHYFKSTRMGRATASAFAIAWSIVLLIFFNFFNQYVAYYHSEKVGNITVWIRQPFFTEDINLWLPILTMALIIAIVGHIIMILFDRYILRGIIHIVIDAFALATVLTLFFVFPFDFSVIPNTIVADASYLGVRILLICISIGIGVGILVRGIKLIVNAFQRAAS